MHHFRDKQTELNSSGQMILQQINCNGKEEIEGEPIG